MLTYKKLIKEKMLTDYKYQREFLENPNFYEPTKPVLLAVGTGGGKTYMTIMKLDIYYSNPENKGKKTVVFPHATNVIRSNFEKSILKYGDVNFKHCVIEDSSQIEDVFNSDCEVIVILPQTVMNHLDKVSKIDWLVVDEAHEWYGQESYTKILNALDPEYQLLLTGTPSKFNRREDEFYYHHISVNMLREAGKLGNARVHIVSSNYNMNGQDILKSGELHSRVLKASQAESSLFKVCKGMLKTLDKNSVVKGDNVADTLFNTLDKTIIFCRTQAQAKRFL
jgi:superfamily II DNA or RNA helicase